jgi:hypothetical protein
MAFNTGIEKLTGKQGYIYKFTLGAEVEGDGIAALDVGYHVVVTVGSPTGFPAVANGGSSIRPGDLIKVRASDTITPETGDATKPVTLEDLCDVSSWTATLSADEIETTTFCDQVRTYARGKTDLQGELSGIVTANVTTEEDGFLNRFLDIAQQDGSTSYDVFTADSGDLLVYLVSSIGDSGADEFGLWAPIEVFGAGLGGEQASAQTFDSSFRIKTDGEVNVVLTKFAVG